MPLQFAPPARDLVTLLELGPGHAVLDVGTGAGLVAGLAQLAVGATGLVVGVDSSFQMLGATDKGRSHRLVAGRVPGLPFASGAFDRVAGGFVISHFTDYGRGLAEMVRVCRSAGRIGVTAWGALGNAPADLWTEVATKYVSAEIFRREFRAEIPWDDWFTDPDRLEQALRETGLVSIHLTRREYRFRTTVPEFLQLREGGVQGVILRRHLDPTAFEAFRRDVASKFGRQFPNTVEWVRDVHFATGLVGSR